MTKLTVRITKDILKNTRMCGHGGGLVSQNCAISAAIRDIFPDASVEYKYIRPFNSIAGSGMIMLPEIATDFIYLFDESTPLQRANLPEMSFDINIPDSIIEDIDISTIKLLLQNHPTLELA